MLIGNFAGLFDAYHFAPHATVIVAVSGGSDLVALLSVLHSEFSGRDIRIVAATVDHALRPEAADEARAVGRFCAALGVEHHILRWDGDKPATGIQAAARLARHRFLAGLARRERASAVFVGHTRDDQAETLLMRAERGDGPGLAGIAPATLFEGDVWFLRPLLNVSRQVLRDYLRGTDIRWIDDPSNVDRRFERVRARSALGDANDEVARLVERGREIGRERSALDHRAGALVRQLGHMAASGLVRLSPEFLAADDRAAMEQALRALLATIGGTMHLPDLARTGQLVDAFRAGERKASLSRAVIHRRKDGIYLLREQRGLPDAGDVFSGQHWDNRFRLVERGLAPLPADTAAPESLVRQAAATLPDVTGQNLALVPIISPWADFLPVFDLELANAVAAMFRLPEFPSPPCRRHIKAEA